jgi:hypothetical protein
MAKNPAALLIDEAGDPVGTAAAPLRIDTTGDTTQPISATALPLPTGASTETTLAAIKNTDGVKKIVDALPIGDNRIGRIKVTDDTNVLGVDSQNHAYVAGKAASGVAPSSNPVSVSGIDGSGLKRSIRTDNMGRIQTVPAAVATALPNMVDLYFRATDGAIVAAQFKRAVTYTVPTGYSGYLIRFTTYQGEVAFSRFVTETPMGTLSFPTNAYVGGSAYVAPQFSGVVEAEVTTQLGSANNVTVTVTYTNQDGVAGRTGTFTIPKSSIVGTRISLVRQAGDIGVRAITGMSAAPSGGAGVIKVLGFIQLAWHNDVATTFGVDTQYPQGAIAFPEGTVLGLEYSGGTVAKDRILEALMQLVSNV